MNMIEIDGSQGEGGGQIIRSSLALSAVTGQPFHVTNIRAGRSRPGLKRQHVAAVNAAAEICCAQTEGDSLQSKELTFVPGPIRPGDFHFSIGSAGSATLVAQTVLPALMLADAPSSVTVEGGTHNWGAPPFDFLDRVYLPQVAQLGPQFTSNLESHGFYPVGGGKFTIQITPAAKLGSLQLLSREQKTETSIRALVSQLPIQIAERELYVLRRKGGWLPSQCQAIDILDSPGPGNVVMLEFDSGNVREMITGFGKKGTQAEAVARQAFRECKPYLNYEIPVGAHLADQLLLPLGLAAGQGQSSTFISGPLSQHSHTHIEILKTFLDLEILVEVGEQNVTQVTISGS